MLLPKLLPGSIRVPAFIVAGLALPAGAVDDLDALVSEHLEENQVLPSLAAVVVVDGEYRAAGAAGVRKKGDPTPVTINDRYHIGSCTKAFTATLAADLVEEGAIGWTSTVGETLDHLRPSPGIADANLLQLLSNTSGLPKEVPVPIWSDAWDAQGTAPRQRADFARAMLRLETPAPGTRYEYSNAGFAIAGVMMESRTETSWEDLVRRRIFVPLGMRSAGFREPARDPNRLDQPWGHNHKGKPIPPGPSADNPRAIAPAGAIHCSLPDLVPWMKMHLESRTGPVLSRKDSFEKLHAPVLDDYALGWVVLERPWAGGPALHHMGSNTMFTTVIWIAPERGFAVAVATNIGHEVGFVPCDGLVGKLIGTYLR